MVLPVAKIAAQKRRYAGSYRWRRYAKIAQKRRYAATISVS
jgi:hypothetical protein